jgi:hypothetical protein
LICRKLFTTGGRGHSRPTFPFSINEAEVYIGKLWAKDGYWLATIAHYDAENYEVRADKFSLVHLASDEESGPATRFNGRASARFRAYCDAFNSIRSEGFNELAEAWWAFFLASQAFVLPGLGLTGSEIAEVAAITLSLPRSRTITKAAAFVVEAERNRKQTLSIRRSMSIFKSIVTHVSNSTDATVKDLTISNVQAEYFLRRHIGGDTWEKLGELSKRDLIEGEKFFSFAAPEIGTDRRDWGSIVALYARPVEAEIREKLSRLMERLAAAGFKADELTIGSCMRIIREAHHAVRRGKVELAESVVKPVTEIFELFKKNEIMSDVRNRADHGNREKPITIDELILWRTAILHHRLFSVLQDVARRN